jgi:hypothetical protein
MASGEDERRRLQRIQFDSPLGAKLEATPVTLLDVSANGARIEHSFPLAKGRIINLSFEYDGRSLAIDCEVIRCQLEKGPGGAAYRSGLRFDTEDASYAGLRDMIADAVMKDFVARQAHIEMAHGAHGQ